MKFLVFVLATALVAVLGVFAACCGGGDNDDPCVFDNATALCQQAYNCCNQYLAWAVETGQPLADQLNCEGYTCIGMQDVTCQGFIDQAVAAEQTYQQDWADCN